MKRILFVLLFLAIAFRAEAQVSFPVVQGSISASSSNCSVSYSCVWQTQLSVNAATSAINISGTFSATLLVEESNNGGQTWASIATLSAAGTTTYNVNGFTDIRVRCSAYTSGTASITINTGLLQVASVVPSGVGSPGTVGGGASPLVSVYFGSNCPTSNTGLCVFTPGAALIDNTATWTNSSPTITATDSPFTTSMIGWQFWGYGNSVDGIAGCNPYIPQPAAAYITLTHLTIASFTDSNHVNLSGNPVNAWSTAGGGCIMFGPPDDAGAANLWTLLNTLSTCPRVTMQNAYYLFTTPPRFLWDQPAACKNLPTVYPNSSTLGNVFFAASYDVEGRDIGPTTILFPPDMPQTGSCNHGVNLNACLAVPPEARFHDFSITSGSGRGGLPASTALINVDVGSLEYFTCYAIGANSTSHLPQGGTAGVLVTHWAQLLQVNVSACGNDGVLVDSSTGNLNVLLSRGIRVHSENAPAADFLQYPAGSIWACEYCFAEGTLNATGTNGFQNVGGTLYLTDSGSAQLNVNATPFVAYSCGTTAGCVLHAKGSNLGGGSLATNTSGINCAVTCTNYLQDTILSGSGTGFALIDSVSTSNTFDGGNNQINGTGVSLTGKYHHRETGTCTFAASTTCAVTFTNSFGSTAPSFLVPPNIVGTATTLTVSALSATSATITASASNSSSVNWEAVMQ